VHIFGLSTLVGVTPVLSQSLSMRIATNGHILKGVIGSSVSKRRGFPTIAGSTIGGTGEKDRFPVVYPHFGIVRVELGESAKHAAYGLFRHYKEIYGLSFVWKMCI
jgi:hypothetical protein